MAVKAQSEIFLNSKPNRLLKAWSAVDSDSDSETSPAAGRCGIINSGASSKGSETKNGSSSGNASNNNNKSEMKTVVRLSNKWSMPDGNSDDRAKRTPSRNTSRPASVSDQSMEFPPPPPPIAAEPATAAEALYSTPHRRGISSEEPGRGADSSQRSKTWDIPSDSDSDGESHPKIPPRDLGLIQDNDEVETISKSIHGSQRRAEADTADFPDIRANEKVATPPAEQQAVKVEEDLREIVPEDPEESGFLKTVIQTQTTFETVESQVPDFNGEDFSQYLQDDDHFVNFIYTLGRKKENTPDHQASAKKDPTKFAFIENPFATEIQYKTVPVQKKTVKQKVTTLIKKDKGLDGNARSIADYATLSRSLQNFAYADSKIGSSAVDDDDDGADYGGDPYRKGGTMPNPKPSGRSQRMGYGSVVSMDQLAAQCKAETTPRQRFQKAKRMYQRPYSETAYDQGIYETIDDDAARRPTAPPTVAPGVPAAAAQVAAQPAKDGGKKGKSIFKGIKKFFSRSKTAGGSSRRDGRAGQEEDYQEFAPF